MLSKVTARLQVVIYLQASTNPLKFACVHIFAGFQSQDIAEIQYVNSLHNEDCHRIIESWKLVTCSKYQAQVSLANSLQYIR
jgi:hypothetical protein